MKIKISVPTVRVQTNTNAGQQYVLQETSLEYLVSRALGRPDSVTKDESHPLRKEAYVAQWKVEAHWETVVASLRSVVNGKVTFPKIEKED